MGRVQNTAFGKVLVASGLSLLVLTAMTVPMTPFANQAAHAAIASSQDPNALKLIETSGTGEINADPDSVHISVAIQKQTASKETALQQTNVATQQVITALKALGYSQMKLNTTSVQVYPIYSTTKNRDEVAQVIGYQANNRLEIYVSHLQKGEPASVGSKIIDTALRSGATNLNSFQAYVDDMSPYKKQALAKAIDDARNNAEVMAQAAGVRVVGVQAIQGSPNYSAPPTFYRAQAFMDGGAEKASTPVETKAVTVSSSVTVSFIFE